MWCFVIVVASLTLTSQFQPAHSQQLKGQRHLNNVQSFKIDSAPSVKKDAENDGKPVMLQRKPRPKQPKKQAKKLLSPEQELYFQTKLRQYFGENYTKSPFYNNIVRRCSDNKKRPGQVLNLISAPFIWPQKELCQGQTDLVIAVHTRPTNFAVRQLIRETYGSVRNVHGKRVVVAFFIGNSGDRVIQERIHEEARKNRDVVLRDFKEHYRNMTIKHLTVMEWMMDYCSNAKHLVKVDDDVFVNIFQVLTYVETFPPKGFYCSRTFGPKPMRSGGKWKLSREEYPRDTFPPYCMGYGYVMRADHAKSLYWCSVFSKFLWIDDVLVGGLLPEKLHLKIDAFLNGHGVTYIMPSHASEKIVDFMFLMGSYNALVPPVFRRLWRASLQYSY